MIGDFVCKDLVLRNDAESRGYVDRAFEDHDSGAKACLRDSNIVSGEAKDAYVACLRYYVGKEMDVTADLKKTFQICVSKRIVQRGGHRGYI